MQLGHGGKLPNMSAGPRRRRRAPLVGQLKMRAYVCGHGRHGQGERASTSGWLTTDLRLMGEIFGPTVVGEKEALANDTTHGLTSVSDDVSQIARHLGHWRRRVVLRRPQRARALQRFGSWHRVRARLRSAHTTQAVHEHRRPAVRAILRCDQT